MQTFSKRVGGLIFAASLLPGCFITDRLEVEPYDSMKGTDVKVVISDAARFLNLLTQYVFIQNGLSVNSTSGSLATDAITAGLIAPLLAEISDSSYYTNSSVEDCRSKIQTEGMLIVTQMAASLRVACNSPPDADCLNQYQSTYNTEGLLGQQLGKLCQLKKTGRVIHLGDKIKL